jgi:epoxide hydrolase-like predicted phosphatase
MIKAIVFDYGGVIKINDSDLIADVCEYLNINKEDWLKEYFKINHLANTQDVSSEDIFKMVTLKFDDGEEAQNHVLDLMKSDKGKYHLNNELIDIIKEFRNKGYKTALLSNNSIELRNKLEDIGIINIFDEVIISAEVGFQKPEPKIFQILFDKLRVKPNEVVFIDDTPRSLGGAGDIGYIPVLFKDNESLKLELSNILEGKRILKI